MVTSLKQRGIKFTVNQEYTRNTYLAISLAKLGLVTALKLNPVRRS